MHIFMCIIYLLACGLVGYSLAGDKILLGLVSFGVALLLLPNLISRGK